MTAYAEMKQGFAAVPPSSPKGKANVRANAEKDLGNFSRKGF